MAAWPVPWIDPFAPYPVQVLQAHLGAVLVGFGVMAVALMLVLAVWTLADLLWRFVAWRRWRGTVAQKMRERTRSRHDD